MAGLVEPDFFRVAEQAPGSSKTFDQLKKKK